MKGRDHAALLSAMLDRLSSADHPRLRELTVRDLGDPSIALLDAAAVLGDQLAFHDARIAAETRLRTATDPASLDRLGALVGYRPRPGLAAGTVLAYRLDERATPEGAQAEVVIPRGSRSRSVPDADHPESQTYETDADLTARAAWNRLAVRRRRPEPLTAEELARRPELFVDGTSTLLEPGDRVALVFGQEARVLPVAKVRVDHDDGVTAITFPGAPPPSLSTLVADVRRALDEPAPSSRFLTEFTEQVLAPLRESLGDVTGTAELVALLVPARERITEAAALTRDRPVVAEWLETLGADLADVAERALELADIRAETPGEPGRRARTGHVRAGAPGPDTLRVVSAMRITAAPFGTAARPQPVTDDGGRIVQVTERPLPGAVLAALRVPFDTQSREITRTEFVVATPGTAEAHTEDLPADRTFVLGNAQITVRATAQGASVRFAGGVPEHEMTVSAPQEDRTVRVSLDDGAPMELEPGGVVYRDLGEDRARIRYAGRTEPAALEVVLSTVPDEEHRSILPLDAVHDTITVGSRVAVERPAKGRQPGGHPGDQEFALVVTKVTEVRTVTYDAYGMTGRGTQLTLAEPWLDDQDTLLGHIQDAVVHAGGEDLRQAGQPLDTDVHGNELELAEEYLGLTPGRLVVVSGERTDIPGTTGVTGIEVAEIAEARHGADPTVPGDHPHTTLVLQADLLYAYRRDTVQVLGNVVAATHGESRDDAIGSGDATEAGQTFRLWQAPLTWLPAKVPGGARPVLEVRVDGLLWHRVDGLAGRGPGERVYVLGTGPDGHATITFGDGTNGARPPTGVENIRARYRYGLGAAGNLPAGRITQPVTRPLGVTGVTNPMPATGGADPDGPGLARRRIPLTVSALDRLVSVQDYADFAKSRAGIGRALAAEVYDGRHRVVHVTVAGINDEPLDDSGPDSGDGPLPALRRALGAYGDPRLPVVVAVRELVPLRVDARIEVARDHTWEIVEPALRAALLRRLGYRGRDLARSAYLSEVQAVAHTVPGVASIDVDVFNRGLPGDPAEPHPVVPARPARFVTDVYRTVEEETLTAIADDHDISLAELMRLNPGIADTRPLPSGTPVVTFRGILPAQFAVLTRLTLTEIRHD